MKKSFLTAVTLGASATLLLSLSSCAKSPSQQWTLPDNHPHWSTLGGSQATFAANTVLPSTLHTLWTRNIPATITSGFSVSPYNLISFSGVAAHGCDFFTLMTESGRKDFCRRLSPHTHATHPLTDKYGNIYSGKEGIFLAYDWYGPLRWSVSVHGTPISSQFVGPNALVVITDTGDCYMLDAHRGSVLTHLNLPPSPQEKFQGPVIVNRDSSMIWISSNTSLYQIRTRIDFPRISSIPTGQQPLPASQTPVPNNNSQLIVEAKFSPETSIQQVVPLSCGMGIVTEQGFYVVDNSLHRITHHYNNADVRGVSVSGKNAIVYTHNEIIALSPTNDVFHILWRTSTNTIISPVVTLPQEQLLVLSRRPTNQSSFDLIRIATDSGKILTKYPIDDTSGRTIDSAKIAITGDQKIILSLSDGLLVALGA